MVRVMGWVLWAGLVCGCTAESTRVAIQTQRRVDDVQQEVFGRQHDGLRILLFRDAVHRVASVGEPLNETQVDVLNSVWNERDLLESWMVQNERAMGLRRVGVDAKLYGSQATLDLLVKQLHAKGRRVEAALAHAAGESLAERAMPPAGAAQAPSAAPEGSAPSPPPGELPVEERPAEEPSAGEPPVDEPSGPVDGAFEEAGESARDSRTSSEGQR